MPCAFLSPGKQVRALGLCSGGLDSILAALLLKDQGIDLTWICFETPFFSADQAKLASDMTGINLIVQDITSIYLKILHNPKAGFGKNMNPCIDCHALMFAKSYELMKKEGYDFLFSGEVIGQRPKSQTKNSMRQVEKLSGCQGKILRPLSALNLPITEMETQGLVNRDSLRGISGRSRKIQMEMAKKFGITQYPAPSGGCLLTDSIFSRRLKDLMQDQAMFFKRHINLLKYGRHFRITSPQKGISGCKLILGRSKEDNKQIMGLHDKTQDVWLRHNELPGPDGLLTGNHNMELIKIAARILAAYTKAPVGVSTQIRSVYKDSVKVIDVFPFSIEEPAGMLLV